MTTRHLLSHVLLGNSKTASHESASTAALDVYVMLPYHCSVWERGNRERQGRTNRFYAALETRKPQHCKKKFKLRYQ